MGCYGAIEAGGTKFVCAVASGPDDYRDEVRFPTTTPGECIAQCVAFFREHEREHGKLDAIGIASFGPVDPDPASLGWGHITTTPKEGWAHTDLAGPFREAFGMPVGFDTDVNAAALAEGRWGAARGLDTFVYITVGTGIGGGAIMNGRPVHGLVHPEMGHVFVPHDRSSDDFPGCCPYHKNCLEGLAAGPAIEQRWGVPGKKLPSDHPAWELEAHYLAHGLAPIIYVLSPQRIIMGGGVMEQKHLLSMVRGRVQKILNGYVQSPAILQDIEQYIVAPELGNRAGALGAVALAMDAV